MDLLSQHEAFLRAIFDAPDDDTPRLVYADFLQENGEEERAEFIRVQCELAAFKEQRDTRHSQLQLREWELHDQLHPERRPWESHEREHIQHVRGFLPAASEFVVSAAWLANPVEARRQLVRSEPEQFGARSLTVEPFLRLGGEQIQLLLSLLLTQRMTEWHLAGLVLDMETAPRPPHREDIDVMIQMTGFRTFPAITTAGLNALAWHRGARRITSLDLRNNNLDNDAARALVKSPYLDNLKRLRLLEGNQFRGRVWQQVRERFGEDVVE